MSGQISELRFWQSFQAYHILSFIIFNLVVRDWLWILLHKFLHYLTFREIGNVPVTGREWIRMPSGSRS